MTFRKNILASWLSHALVLAIGFVLMPFARRTLGDDGYGTWIFVNSIAGYGTLLYMGFGSTIVRYASRHAAREEWEELNQYVSAVFFVYCGTASLVTVFSLAFCGLAGWMDWEGQPLQDVRIAIILLGLSTGLGMIGSVYGGVLVGLHRVGVKRAAARSCAKATNEQCAMLQFTNP